MARLSRFCWGYGGYAPHVKPEAAGGPVVPFRGRCRWRVLPSLAPCQALPVGLATMPVRFADYQKLRSPEQLPTVHGPLAILQSVLERTAFHAILLHHGCGRTCPP